MIVSLLISLALVTLCIFLHAGVLRRLGVILHVAGSRMKHPLMLVLFALFGLHLLEVMLYAIAMQIMEDLSLGHVQGVTPNEPGMFYDFFYFSMASYTTLGIGDLVPHGPIRMVAVMESLTGLILIAWSASFTYLAMERLWRESVTGSPDET